MVNSTATANALIQEQVAGMLIEPLEGASVVLAAGPTVFNSAAPLRIKKLTSGTNPEWVGENELIPEDNVDFDEIKLMPSERKSIKVITRVSNELIRAATDGVSAVLEQRLVKDVANKLDQALLTGTGADDSVTGIINQPGVERLAHDPTDPDSYLDALALAASNEVQPTRFILPGADFFALRKIKDSDGRYIMTGGPSEAAPYMLHGTPVTITNKLAPGTGILANMKEVAVVRDTDPTVTILNERYAEYDQVGIRVTSRYDLGLLRPEGVVVLDAAAA